MTTNPHQQTQNEYTRHIKQCDMFMMVIAIGFFIASGLLIVETFKYLGL